MKRLIYLKIAISFSYEIWVKFERNSIWYNFFLFFFFLMKWLFLSIWNCFNNFMVKDRRHLLTFTDASVSYTMSIYNKSNKNTGICKMFRGIQNVSTHSEYYCKCSCAGDSKMCLYVSFSIHKELTFNLVLFWRIWKRT